MRLVDEIKGALDLEVRASSDGHEYFEAVFISKDLAKLTAILEKSLGEPLKPPGKDVKFAKSPTGSYECWRVLGKDAVAKLKK